MTLFSKTFRKSALSLALIASIAGLSQAAEPFLAWVCAILAQQ
jgi:hypothetical protein